MSLSVEQLKTRSRLDNKEIRALMADYDILPMDMVELLGLTFSTWQNYINTSIPQKHHRNMIDFFIEKGGGDPEDKPTSSDQTASSSTGSPNDIEVKVGPQDKNDGQTVVSREAEAAGVADQDEEAKTDSVSIGPPVDIDKGDGGNADEEDLMDETEELINEKEPLEEAEMGTNGYEKINNKFKHLDFHQIIFCPKEGSDAGQAMLEAGEYAIEAGVSVHVKIEDVILKVSVE